MKANWCCILFLVRSGKRWTWVCQHYSDGRIPVSITWRGTRMKRSWCREVLCWRDPLQQHHGKKEDEQQQLQLFCRIALASSYCFISHQSDSSCWIVLCCFAGSSCSGLFETLSESLESCFFLNKVSPVDLIGAVSYISSIKQIKEGIEEVKIITLGLKDLDVARELAGVKLPLELFTMSLHRKQVEALCADYAPILQGKIVVKSSRSIIRQSPFAQQRSIPLL